MFCCDKTRLENVIVNLESVLLCTSCGVLHSNNTLEPSNKSIIVSGDKNVVGRELEMILHQLKIPQVKYYDYILNLIDYKEFGNGLNGKIALLAATFVVLKRENVAITSIEVCAQFKIPKGKFYRIYNKLRSKLGREEDSCFIYFPLLINTLKTLYDFNWNEIEKFMRFSSTLKPSYPCFVIAVACAITAVEAMILKRISIKDLKVICMKSSCSSTSALKASTQLKVLLLLYINSISSSPFKQVNIRTIYPHLYEILIFATL